MAGLAEGGQIRSDLDKDRGGGAEVEVGHSRQHAQNSDVVGYADG